MPGTLKIDGDASNDVILLPTVGEFLWDTNQAGLGEVVNGPRTTLF